MQNRYLPKSLDAATNTNKSQEKVEPPMTCYEKLSLLAQFSILIATGIYAWFARGQWRSIADQADIATEGVEANRMAVQAAQRSADAALEGIRTSVITQRAYLNASPSPPQDALVEVVIKNYGETPATVTAIAMQIDAKLHPTSVNLTPDKDFSGHFLVKTEWFIHEVGIPEHLRGLSYFLFGYVEYVTFDKCHRLTFARQFDHRVRKPRFTFIAEGDWNHDRPC